MYIRQSEVLKRPRPRGREPETAKAKNQRQQPDLKTAEKNS